MDSVSQAALGAAVGVVVLGRRRPFWQAALGGALVGTLPDLDVFLDKGGPIHNMVLHRAETHAFFWQLFAAFPMAGLLALLSRSRQLFRRWLWMVLAVLFTHSLLDTLTVYGTRILLPFSDAPFATGSLFIVDPLYTLPLLLGLLGSASARGVRRYRWNRRGLIVSILYAGWALLAQAHVTGLVMATPQAAGLRSEQVLVVPTPLNTVLWRVLIVEENHYREGFYSLLDPLLAPQRGIRFSIWPRGHELDRATSSLAQVDLLRDFAKGFYRFSSNGEYITFTDLRMGQEPFYVFNFHIARADSPQTPIAPIRVRRSMPSGNTLMRLYRRMFSLDVGM